MATRHNLCRNPACSVDITGWENQGAIPPSRVTGLTGFPVTTGARYDTNGTFLRTQLGTASPGVQYTLSCYIKPENFNLNGNIYIEWARSAGGPTYSSTSFSALVDVVTRISLTDVAPANTVSAAIIVDGGNHSSTPRTVTAVLIEAVGSADTYFDGDSPSAAWDGTTGLSASTLTDSNDGVLAATLPALTAALTSDTQNDAVLAGVAPALTGSFTADSLNDAVLAGSLPQLTAALTSDAQTDGILAGTLPALTAALTADEILDGVLAGTFPLLQAAFTDAEPTHPGHVTITASRPGLTITATRRTLTVEAT